MKKLCQCSHDETIHVLGVCAVLTCSCVRRDLQATITENGTIPVPLFLGGRAARSR